MATEKQIAANQRNAELSTGPRTAEGKNVSRLNAYRHGITAHIDVETPEEKEIRDTFCAAIVASLKPADPVESQLAQSVAEGYWRLNRIRTVENNIFAASSESREGDDEVDLTLAPTRAFLADPSRFHLLTIYEMRIHRKTQNELKQLREIQAARRALEDKEKAETEARRAEAWEEAKLLLELSVSEGEDCDPAATFTHRNGFVFSNAKIIEDISYVCRLQAAQTQFHRWRNAVQAA